MTRKACARITVIELGAQKMKLMDYETDSEPLDVKSFDRMFGETNTNQTWSREIPTFTDARLLKAIYFTEDWIYILVDKIAMMLAPIPLKVFKETKVNGELISEPAENHPVQFILDNPNKFQTNYDLQYTSITDYCVTGNIILYNAIINRTLIHIPAEIINMDIDGNGALRSYSILGFDRQSMPLGQLKSRIDPSNIIHIKRPNPSSIHWGMSPLIPGQSPVLFNRYSSEYLNNFYRKGAQPGMVISTPEGVTQKQREDLQNSLEKQNMGRQNQRRFLVLPNGAKGDAFAHTIADQQLLEHIKNNRETIINLFGVPKEVLSIQDSAGGLGSDQYKQAIKSFWNGTLMSIGNMYADALTKAYRAYLGEDYKIRKDYSQVPELQENLKEKSDLATAMLSTMTLNEVRKQVWKLEPIAGGDLPPQSARPQQTFGGFGGGFPQQSSSQVNMTGAPVPIESVEQKPSEEMSTDIKLDYKSENLVNFGRWTREEGKSWWTDREEKAIASASKKEESIRELFLDLILEQVSMASSIARDELIQKAVDMPNEEELKKRIKKSFAAQRKQWTQNYSKILEDQVELGYDSVLSMPFGKPDLDAIEGSRDENFKKRRAALFKRAEDSYNYLSDTTISKVLDTITRGIAENKNLKEIGNDIKEIAKISMGRADTIARTEVLTAQSLGQAAAMNDAAKVIDDLYKVWVNAGDERVRGNPGGIYPDSKGDHWSIAGEAIPYDKAFGNGLMYPREGGGPPHEVINCRCTILTLSKKDLKRLGIREQ